MMSEGDRVRDRDPETLEDAEKDEEIDFEPNKVLKGASSVVWGGLIAKVSYVTV